MPRNSPPRHKGNEHRKAEILRLYALGNPMGDIAHHLRCSVALVAMHVHRNGLYKAEQRAKHRRKKREEVLEKIPIMIGLPSEPPVKLPGYKLSLDKINKLYSGKSYE